MVSEPKNSVKGAITLCRLHMCDPVISVRVLRLLHNNSIDLQLIGLLLWYCTTCHYQTTATTEAVGLLTFNSRLDSTPKTLSLTLCTVLRRLLKYAPGTSIIGQRILEPGWRSWPPAETPSSMYPTVERLYISGPFKGLSESESEKRIYTTQTFFTQFWVTLNFMRGKCPGQRKSLTVHLNSRPVRRMELYTKVCTALFWVPHGELSDL